MVIISKHFSRGFKFDLCYDFSFWQAGTGRCIPKEMYDDENRGYSFTPLCNRTEFDCMHGVFTDYCPNKDESCEDYDDDPEKLFFCNDSKTCIPKGEFIGYK